MLFGPFARHSPFFPAACLERFSSSRGVSSAVQGGFYFHPSDENLSLGTPERKKPLSGSGFPPQQLENRYSPYISAAKSTQALAPEGCSSPFFVWYSPFPATCPARPVTGFPDWKSVV